MHNDLRSSVCIVFSFWLGIGARERREDTEESRAARIEKISGAVRTILECIGEDPNREGLLKTPERYAKALMFFSKGYEESVTRKDTNGHWQHLFSIRHSGLGHGYFIRCSTSPSFWPSQFQAVAHNNNNNKHVACPLALSLSDLYPYDWYVLILDLMNKALFQEGKNHSEISKHLRHLAKETPCPWCLLTCFLPMINWNTRSWRDGYCQEHWRLLPVRAPHGPIHWQGMVVKENKKEATTGDIMRIAFLLSATFLVWAGQRTSGVLRELKKEEESEKGPDSLNTLFMTNAFFFFPGPYTHAPLTCIDPHWLHSQKRQGCWTE